MTTPTQDEIRQMVEALRGASSRPARNELSIGEFCNLCDDAADLLSRLAQQEPVARCEGWKHMSAEDRTDFDAATYCDAYEGHESADACPPGCCATAPVAAPVPVAQQEPVAWRYARPPRSGPEWKYCDYEPTNAPPEWLKEPLYAAPVPAPKE